MTENLQRKAELKKQFPLLMMLGLIGIASLGIGVLASNYMHSPKASTSQSASANQALLQEFIDTSWKNPYGEDVNSSAWKDKVLVINFWASWCPPCVEEMPTFTKLSKLSDAKSTQFVGIGIDSPSNMRDFLEKRPVSYPIVNGGLDGTSWSKRFGNTDGALPYTVILDHSGKILFQKLGKISEEELQKALNLKS